MAMRLIVLMVLVQLVIVVYVHGRRGLRLPADVDGVDGLVRLQSLAVRRAGDVSALFRSTVERIYVEAKHEDGQKRRVRECFIIGIV